MQNLSKIFFCLLVILAFPVMKAGEALAVQQPVTARADAETTTKSVAAKPTADNGKAGAPTQPSVEDRLKAMEQIIEHQQREIQALRELVEKGGSNPVATPASESLQGVTASHPTATSGQGQTLPAETQKKVEELYKNFGAIRFSGDLRFRQETFRNQGFDDLKPSADRNRMRVRVRLALDGTINKHYDWGLRLASGIFTDPISSNQTLTDFFERKPFALERAFLRYDTKTERLGAQLIAGKFEPTFRRTQMVWDDDVNVEGASEAVYFKTKTPLRQVKLVAFQLPFNELSGSKDGVLYGGQLQSDWQVSNKVSANANLSYYDWNHADQVLQGLGALATQVNGGIFNGAASSGNQNGAFGTTNRILRNGAGAPIGFLANFHLVNFLGNLTWQATSRYPVTFTFDYVHNASRRIADEKDGYWVGAMIGQTKEKGDWLWGYTYTRIEQDAVLVPFNFSDILASNSRAHMPTVAYQLANGVTLQWSGLFSQRVKRLVLLSPFNRFQNRMQFDVIYKF
ncbi:MAG: putative porin [Acidobacteria bacterium]|nr:putative porin [Acidobacteriota bacterium]